MAKGRLESQWWQTSWIVAAIRNSMQTDRDKLVTPDDVNPMTPAKPRRMQGDILTGAEFEVAFKRQIVGRKGS